jgi:hypothetical protein
MHRLLCLLAFLGLGALPLVAEPPKKPPRKPPPPEEVKFGVPDAALQEQINRAIDRGAAWLKAQQKPNGAFAPVVVHTQAHYQMGASALCGLALLASGEVPQWRAIRDGKKDARPGAVDAIMAFCRGRDTELAPSGSRTTYESGALLMFITEYYREPPVEVKPKGHTQQSPGGKNPCNLPPEILNWLQDITTWLAGVQKETGGFGYPGHREDLSNTQYALLGLRAARDCGAIVPVTVFEKALQMALRWQEQDGPKVKRIIPSPDPTSGPYVLEAGDRARGFPYLLVPHVATGSMTTSGIALLAIAHDALMRPKRLPRFDAALENRTTRAIEDAFCWLDQNWTVAKNPGKTAPNWHLYYLYGLERAGALAGRLVVGQHDWYVEGARHLVGMQKEDGRWSTGALGNPGEMEGSDVCDTAWALLFLKRATRPAPPILPPQVTEGD